MMRRIAPHFLALRLRCAPVILLNAQARHSGRGKILVDAQLLVVRQGIHRIEEDRREPGVS